MDLADQLVDTWRINNRLNGYFLDALDDEALLVKAAKGKSVGSHFAHIHNVRLMWIKSAAPEFMGSMAKLDNDNASHEQIKEALSASAIATESLLKEGIASGRIKGFKPHPTGFLGYLISHETYHRAQAELALRLAGRPLDDRTSYGLWEWGVR